MIKENQELLLASAGEVRQRSADLERMILKISETDALDTKAGVAATQDTCNARMGLAEDLIKALNTEVKGLNEIYNSLEALD